MKRKRRLSHILALFCAQSKKVTESQRRAERRNAFRLSLGSNVEQLEGRAMMAVYAMSTGDKSWTFADISSWTASTGAGQVSYAGATDATYWAGLPVNTSGTLAAGTRISTASQAFVSGTTGGVQKGTQALQFLSTGTNNPANSTAVDLQLSFTGRNAGVLSFDWAAIDNGNGTRPTSLQVFYSTDNVNFTELVTAATLNRESATSPSSGTISAVALPSAFNNASIATLRFLNSAGSNTTGGGNRDKLQIDNVAVTSTSATTPTITGSATATAFTTTYGTASTAQTFSVGGSNLTANITATAPAGFQVSSDGTTFGSTATFTQSGGNVSGTLSLRLTATATVGGTYNSQTVSLTSTGASTVNITTASSGNVVATKALTITGLSVNSKTYNGNAAATLSGTAAYSGLVNGESFAVSGTPAATFSDSNVGSNKSVTVTGYTAPSANYTVTQPALTGDITAAPLSVTANNVTKVQGTTLTSGAGSTAFTSSGLIGSESIGSVTISYGSGAAAGDIAGTYTGSVVPSAATGGTFSSSNYNITYVPGDIVVSASPTISVTGTLTAVNTTYGSASPTPSSFNVSGGFLTGDLTVTAPAEFEIATSPSGTYTTALTITQSGGNVTSTEIFVRLKATAFVGTYSGNLLVFGGNATPVDVPTAPSSVAPKALTITGLIATAKAYDGTLNANVAGTPVYNGLANGDTFDAPTVGTWSYANKLVGTSKALTRSVAYAAPSSNYTLSQPALTADITAAVLTVNGASVVSKSYDGNTGATITGTLTGVIGADAVSLIGGGTFATASAGNGIAVISSLSLSGADSGNYSLTQPTALSGDINKASQTITFGSLSPKLTSDAPFNLTASASSGLAVTYTSSNPSVVTISGSTVTIVGAGAVTITASQAGDGNFEAAASVDQSFTVYSPTVLAAGDIAVIGFVTNGSPDSFTIVVLKDLTPGTSFFVNDNEVSTAGSATFSDLNEHESSFTVKSGQFIPAGTVITLPWGQAAVSTSTYDWSSTSAAGFSNPSNDEVYIYTAPSITSATPTTFIYGAALGTSSSARPAGLTSGTTFINPTGTNFARYKTIGATYTGTKGMLLAAIGNTASNWEAVTPGATTNWTFNVVNNTAPTDLALASTSIDENAASGTTVGTFSSTDANSGDTFTYSLVSGTGSTDNASFTIDNTGGVGTLKTADMFDFETKSSYAIRVRTTDAEGLTFEKTFTISVNNVNETPTDIVLSSTSIAENAGANATVGTLSTTDPDAGNTFTYSLVSGTGSDDNSAFTISGSTLTANSSFDFDTKSSYTVRVRSTDQGSLFAEKAFVITVTNVNEAPVFGQGSYTFSIAENSASTTAVGSVSATDPDAGATLTYGLTGAGASNFAINPSTGAIMVAVGATLDFDTTPNYSLTVSVSDGSLSATAPVTINLTNVNEAPVFGAASYTFSVAENSASATAVGSVSATDPDAATTLTYSLTGTGASNFAITPSTGAITVAAGATLDFDTTPSYSLTVSVSDGSLSATVPVTINLTNVNETPTDIALSNATIAENAGINATVGSLSTTDPDLGNTFIYSLVSGTGSDDNSAFTISGSTLTANSSFDFDTKSSYTVRIRSTDQGSLFTEKAFVITVTNVNEAPVFGQGSYTFSIVENSAATTAVGSVSATDPDAGATLTYSLTGTGSSNFAINPSSGAITVAAGATLDFDTTPSYSLTVSVSDGSLSATAPVTINLTNVNEAPVFGAASYIFSVAENSASTTAVGSINATDVDATTTLTYSLTGTGSSNFAINPSTGAITVAAGATLDFDTTPSYSLTVSVSDGSLSATAPVTINLTNVNEAPTDIALSNATIAENAGINATVGSLSTTDPDASNAFTYSLVSGTGSDDNSAFTISGSTLTANSSFDFDTKSSYTVRVRSTDQESLFVEKAFVITVTNANEAPVFGQGSYTFSVAENSASTTAVGSVSATDPDAGATLTYSLTGTGSSNFAINPSNGAITVAAGATLDFDTTSSYSLLVSVSDGSLSATAPVTINLTNVNESPVFGAASYTFSLAENSASTTVVGSVSATDPDAATTLTYSLAGTGSTNFAINPSTGAITVAAGATLDFDTTPSYSLTVSVSDGSLSATAPVTINLTNVNEAPVFGAASYTFSIAENSATTTAVGSVSAADPDAGATLTYSLTGTGSSNFEINPSTGAITVAAGATLNFETTPSYSLTVSVSDGSLSATAPVTINLTNVNEPPTDIAISNATIAENAGANATIGTLSTTDPDAGNTFTYSLVSGIGSDDNSAFTVGGNTLTANASFDFDTKSSYTVRVRSTDQSMLFTEKAFVITVTNANEAPAFGAASYTFSIAENSAGLTVVGSVSATDPDAGATLTYSLTGTGSSNFAINPSTGAITVASGATLDFDTTPSFSLTVSVSDGSLSATAPVTINLTNVNEAPVFGAASYSFSIAENSASATAVGSVSATDADAATTLTYSLTGTGSSNFAIDPLTGAITVAPGATLDFDTTPSYSLTVSVSDGGLSATAPVTINLTNINEAPVFGAASYSFSVAENSASTTAVGSVSATDADSGATLTYSLSGTGSSNFAINPSNGAITVAAGATLNFETTPSYSLTVSVSDGSLSATAPVTINLTNVNEAPIFGAASYTFSVAENSTSATAVGSVSATDADAATTLTYSLTGTGSTNFAIHPSTGAITVAAGATLDFDTTPSYSLTVSVSDGSLSATAPVTINLTNVNETPTDIAISNATIAENAGANATIGTLSTTDPDAGNTFTYSLVSGIGSDDNSAFTVGGNTLRANASFDFDTKSSYTVRIRSTDQGSLFNEKAFVITVTNANEAPVFGQGNYTFSIAENSASTTAVGSVSATDPDAGATLTYSLTGTGSSNFAINPSTGTIAVAAGATLDFDTTPSYSLTVSVSDGSLSATAPVTINLTNVNEAPVFGAASYSFSIAENSAAATTVGTVSATDPDAVTTLVYSLSGTGSSNFAINPSTGAITVAASATLNFETTPSYSLTVTASDGTLSATAPVNISLTNINEAPVFGAASYSFSVAENSATATAVGSVSASDPDAATTLVYSLSGTGSSNFVINPSTGLISVAAGATLDFDTTPSYSLTVSVSDGSLSAMAPVTINVTNANEAPVFDAASYGFLVAENSASTTAVGSVSATDPDAGSTLTYSLSGTGSSNFAINPTTGAITVAASATLDFETAPSFTLTASVSDGVSSATVPVTITLTNVNEAPTNIALSNASLAENAGINATVGTLSTTDVDVGDTFTYTFVSGTGSNDNVAFTISGNTLTANANFDFETKSSYTVRVRSTDQSGLSTEKTFAISVTNVNEAPTDIALSNASVAENSGSNATVGTLSTVDADGGGTFTYMLASGVGSDDNAAFNISGSILRANASFDFETKSNYTVRVRSTDQGGFTTEKTFPITVTNVNEAPVLGQTSYVYTIAENASSGTMVGTPTASDPDAVAVITFSLSGTGSNHFMISPTTGAISVAAGAGLDFETTPTYALIVSASDGSLAGSTQVTINLTDANDAPVFASASYSFSVPENSAGGTSIGTVSASDADVGSTLTYSLSGTGATLFTINSVTGAIAVAAGANLDYETTPSYSLTASVTDGTLTTTVPVTIALTDLNDQPSIAPQTFSMAENSANGSTVGTIVANAANSFAITGGNSSGAFTLDANSGLLTVANVAALNFEVTPSFSLTVTIMAIGGVTASNTVTVNLTNVNESPTLLEQSLVVNENAANGTVIGSVTATDPDASDTLTFTITDGNSNGALAISSSGQVSVADSTKLNYEVTPVIALTVLVTDAAGLTSSNTVSVLLNDLNESPVVTASLLTIAENSATGTIIGSASATDPDQGQTLTYRFSNGQSTSGPLQINATTGEIRVLSSSSLNYEIYNNSIHTIQVLDNGSPVRSGSAQVTLTLIDVNEAPAFSSSSYTFDLLENEPAGTAVGTARAFDPDAGATVTHSLSGTGASNFSIDSTTGAITVAAGAEFDAIATPVYSLTVQATDGTFNVSVPVTINVRNFNYFPVINSQSFSVPENSAVGTAVGTVVATDRDSEQTLTYAITGGNSTGAFAINSSTGQITVANTAPLDRETRPSFTLTVTVSDSGDPSLSASNTVFISLSNVNEAPTIPAQTFSVEEGAPNGATVGFIFASDVDAGDSKTFAIVSGNSLGAFALNTSTGRLTIADTTKLEFDVNPTFALVVSVTDGGGLSASNTVTINLTNVDYPPTINSQSFTIPENLVNGSSVGVVVASDRDQFDTKTFSITSDPNSAFSINPSTGRISVADFTKLNFESLAVLPITVTVTDSTNLSASVTITINLTDVNEVPVPSLSIFAFTVSENSLAGSSVGTVTATDPDAGSTLNYSLSGAGLSNFAINTSTGVITVAAGASLDFETTPSYNFAVQVSDGELSATATVTVTLANVNDAPTIAAQTFSILENSANGSVVGTVVATDVDAGDTKTFAITSGNSNGAFAIDATTGALTVANSLALDFETTPTIALVVSVTDAGGLSASNTVTIELSSIVSQPLFVQSVTPNSNGFNIVFNRPISPAQINLYDQGNVLGEADVTLVGATSGPVRGSLVLNSTNTGATFIKTGMLNASGGVAGTLVPDTYTLTLRSNATNGFVDVAGNALRNTNNVAADYVQTFVVGNPVANALTLSIPDFARGFDQSVNVPNTSTGLPVIVSNANNIRAVDVTINYNPALLTITGVSTPIAGASATIDTSTLGTAVIQLSSATAFAIVDGAATILNLIATVPASAPYSSKGVIRFASMQVRDTNLVVVPSIADDAVHVAAFFGDLNADQDYDSADSILVQRLGVGTNSGVTAYQTLDPFVIADSLNDYVFDSADSITIQRLGVGIDVPAVPDLPQGAGGTVVYGADPKLSIGVVTASSAAVGTNVFVPINLLVTEASGITLAGIDIAISFDPGRFEVNAGGVTVASSTQDGLIWETDAEGNSNPNLAGVGFSVARPKIDNVAGTIRIQAFSADGTTTLPFGTSGALLRVRFTIKADAAAGPSAVNLMANVGGTTTRLRDNNFAALLLVPAPTNASTDAIDGSITIPGTGNSAPTGLSLSAAALVESAANATIGEFTSSDSTAESIYSLVSGAGDADNAAFNILGDTLRASENFDFGIDNNYSIRVRTTDQDGLFCENEINVNVTIVNEAPLDDSSSFAVDAETGAITTSIGTGLAFVPAIGTWASYEIRIRVTNRVGLFFDKTFGIDV